ncbi:hypothetical protein CLOP_g2365, partial [Closterium sp. NIES-67]
ILTQHSDATPQN